MNDQESLNSAMFNDGYSSSAEQNDIYDDSTEFIREEIKMEMEMERKQNIVSFSKKYLDTYHDGMMYFKDEIIIDVAGTKSKIYNGCKPMEYFYNLNSQNENSKDSNTILP